MTALLVSPDPSDYPQLSSIFRRRNWLLYQSDVLSAQDVISQYAIPLMLIERDISAPGWQGLFQRISLMPNPPLMVVVSRLADEILWSQVLNIGGYDVLAKPFRDEEVVHVLVQAWYTSESRLTFSKTGASSLPSRRLEMQTANPIEKMNVDKEQPFGPQTTLRPAISHRAGGSL